MVEFKLKLDKIMSSNNIADSLDEDQLIYIGNQVSVGYENDLASRKDWEKDLTNWTELALQISNDKTYPWPNAANIKYPLLATAAMQFAARAYPTLVPSNGKIVKVKIVGSDPQGEKAARAKRVSTHMSYQLIDEMSDWEEDMDKLLITLPIAGTCFKKTYWDPNKQRNCSKLVLPKTLVVNYWTRNIEDAERITEIFYLSKRKVTERINQGIYIDAELGDPQQSVDDPTTSVNKAFQRNTSDDDATPYLILEQHTYFDLDGDGYPEPYIVTVEEATKKVLRIVPRFSESGVMVNDKNKIMAIEATQYYTKYGFIPNPDGGFYDIGFGRLLGPLNNSANTIINQLVDAGSLSNLQAGFIGKGLRIKMGESRFQPGEWKAVNAVGDDLKKQIFPLPVREPSQVLFNLLDLLLKSGKELASVAEIFVGKMPGQNTPATTTMATIEQGMKVFTAVYKRIYRSLTKEFRKIYALNREYMNHEEYVSVLDEPVPQSDYQGPEDDIIPGADPTAVSSQEKQAKLQSVMQIMQMGTIDPMWFTQQYLEAHEIPNAEKALKQPSPPPPDPKMEALKAKAQVDQQKAQMDMQMASAKLQMEGAAKEQEARMKAEMLREQLKGKQMEAVLKGKAAIQDMQIKGAQAQQNMATQAMQHHQSLVQQHQTGQQTLRLKEQQAKQQSKGDVKNESSKSR
jgi:chaperonin GroES